MNGKRSGEIKEVLTNQSSGDNVKNFVSTSTYIYKKFAQTLRN